MTETRPATMPEVRDQPRTERPRAWNVVLFNDEEHSFEYVIAMLQRVFAFSFQKAFEVTHTAHTRGRAVCLTTHLEHAELKRDQILASGPDPLMVNSTGPCRSIIEPAEGEGDSEGRS